MAQAQVISIPQDTRLIWNESLPIEVGAVMAAQVNNVQGAIPFNNDDVAA